MCSFLGIRPVDRVVDIDFSHRKNVAVEPKNLLVYRCIKKIVTKMRLLHCEKLDFFINYLTKLSLRKFLERPLTEGEKELDQELQNDIRDYFMDDIEKLENLIGLNLSHWK